MFLKDRGDDHSLSPHSFDQTLKMQKCVSTKFYGTMLAVVRFSEYLKCQKNIAGPTL